MLPKLKIGIGSDFFDANYFKQNCNFGDEKELKDMENKGHTYSYLDRAISTLAWDNAALTELDNLVKDIENGKRIFKRFCKRGSYAFKSSGQRATKASIILMLTSSATSVLRIALSIATPCSVNTYGLLYLPPRVSTFPYLVSS